MARFMLVAPVPDHFHVHIVNASYSGLIGMNVGQAHLLDDLINLVSVVRL